MKFREYILSALVLLSIGFAIWSKLSAPKLAYVRTTDLVNGYQGMKEASKEYQTKNSEWQNSIDSLKRILQSEIDLYTRDSLQFSAQQKNIKMNYINRLQDDLVAYTRTLSEKASSEDEQMTQRVLNQVNSFVEQYGNDHDYDMIYGTTASGNIMFGKKGLDITEEVMETLNNNYKK